ncbi:MAG: hypothetical protein KGK12_07220 [Armatimonadetes bacterium]|nr:hypothetical protein [Armatimonadota bacterium]
MGSTSTSFTMDNDDELTATSGGFANSYSYNANGEQTGRTLAGTAYSLAFDYDGLGSARAETNSSGTATATQDFDAFETPSRAVARLRAHTTLPATGPTRATATQGCSM